MGANRIVVKVDGSQTDEIDFDSAISGLSAGAHTITVEAYDGSTLIDSQTKNVTVPSSGGGGSTPTTGVVSDYALDETTGDAIDSIGGHDGAIFGSMVRNGETYEFNGTNTRVAIADNDDHSFVDGGSDAPFTIRCILNFKDFTNGWIIARRDGSDQEYQFLIYDDLLTMTLWETGFSSSIKTDIPVSSLVLDKDYHTVITYDGSKAAGGLKMTLDKNIISTSADGDDTATYGGMVNRPIQTVFGTYGDSSSSNSNIFLSKVRFHKGYKWTSQEIVDDYNAIM